MGKRSKSFNRRTTGVHNADLFERFPLGFELLFAMKKIATQYGGTCVSYSSIICVTV